MNIPENPTLLGLDTAGSSCSVAVMQDGEIVATRLEEMRRGQSERLLPLVDEVLAEVGLELMDMDGFAVTTGPGGFTGVRIGMAAAQGFALACGKPLVGASNFEVMARAVPENEKSAERVVTVLIDAKRADVFAQCFASDLTRLTDPFSQAPEHMAAQLPKGDLLLVGDGVDQVLAAIRDAGREFEISKVHPRADAGYLLRLAVEKDLFAGDQVRLSPLYLRPPDVSLPKSKPPKSKSTTPKSPV